MIEAKVYGLGSLMDIPAAVWWLLLGIFVIGVVELVWSRELKEGLRAGAVLLLAEWAFVLIASAVLFREVRPERAWSLVPLWSYFHIGENSYPKEMAVINLLNVAMFVPVGFLLGCGFRKMTWRRALIVGLCLSVAIELLQLAFRRGLCETDDVIHNVVGALIGFWLLAFGRWLFLEKHYYHDQK